ncbi:MAG: putative SOS response-associated peptidase YedK [Alcanivorax sp.]|jgi:putative SOS response-associated peptidase YedK
MCGRFNVIDNPGLQQLLQGVGIDLKLPPGINLAPTESVPLVRTIEGAIDVQSARWWLTPSWAPVVDQKYAMFNARSESLTTSKAYAQPFKRQRAVVPMSSFIEWRVEEGVKQPWLISNPEKALAIAALWDIWNGGEQPLLSCTLVTTAAAEQFKPWHKRMPVMLTGEEVDRWLDNGAAVPAEDPLFQPKLKMSLHLSRLARTVSNARTKEISVLTPLDEAIVLKAD